MKRYFGRPLVIVALAIVVTVSVVIAAAINSSFPTRAGNAQTSLTSTYDTAQIDTVTYVREAGVSGLAFSASWNDSVELNNIIMRRIVNGVLCPVVAGDTLVSAYSSQAASVSRTFTVTLAPLADQYRFVINYDSALGVAGTPTATYIINRQYAK